MRKWFARLVAEARASPVLARRVPADPSPRDAPPPRDAYRAAHEHFLDGALDTAEGILRDALAGGPDDPDNNHLLGVVLAQQGRLDEAGDQLARACLLAPGACSPFVDHATVLRLRGDNVAAIEGYRTGRRLDPDDPRAAFALGELLLELGRTGEAIEALEAGLAIEPDAAMPRFALGTALALEGRLDAAIDALRATTRVAADFAPAHANLGRALQQAFRLEEAGAALERAVTLEPDLAEAHNSLGGVRSAQGLATEGEASYRRVLEIDPTDRTAHGNLCLSLNYRDDLTPAEVFAEHRRFAQRCPAARPLPPPGPERGGRPLRVGYLSADFRRHSVAQFIEPVLAHHDPERVTTVCYADVARADDVTARLRGLSGAWHDISMLDNAAALELIRGDRPDILVELGGHTASLRLAMLAERAAPVQVTWIGYTNTTGLDSIDYRLTDAIADPPGDTEQWHSERLVRLPGGFLLYAPPPDAPAPGPPPEDAADCITFGSFNNLNKVSATCLALWARVLDAVPRARLRLKARQLSDPGTRSRWVARLEASGIAPERTDLLGYLPDPLEHLAAYHAVDIALDTYPYHGTTTTCEALWMGVPVVALAGPVHAARVGASLLSRVGLADCAAHDPGRFVAAALALAGDRERRGHLRETLRETVRTSTLCDGPRFVGELETTYRALVDANAALVRSS